MSSATAARLTQYSPGGGCACKMPQGVLADLLSGLRSTGAASAGLRVGLDPADDAAIYDLAGLTDRSLVLTCDFITPVVDEPRDWGRIAAANALSDVYAMGGRPLLALNLVGWPGTLDPGLLGQVVAGGAETLGAAGAALAGGHSISDPAPKYGLAVVGEVPRSAILRKGGGKPGDLLVLTKALGVGVVSTAIKRGGADSAVVAAAVRSMCRLNADAAATASRFGLSGGTDVTGFGLIGHLHEMGVAGGVSARIDAGAVPLLPGVRELVARGFGPDGSRVTLRTALDRGWFRPGNLDADMRLLLADAQTSGGLLLAVPPATADDVVADLRRKGEVVASVVGELVEGSPGLVSAEAVPR
ncbi:selenide, water dikinase SelD [Amycolatopsis ultiminotia]|uniref:Selenide, water dikinase n=1 Tax=Amycolatopsis ultiminotia TaxID=543629 RepID=A0ABP6V143_9PSEU